MQELWEKNFSYCLRVLADPDIFLHTDLGIRQALGETNAKRMMAIAASWQPWRSYATLHLWKSLERGKGVFAAELAQFQEARTA
jgi:3-methyladenine DNA glycosylase/8-oxoguanine DNA glycosylase